MCRLEIWQALEEYFQKQHPKYKFRIEKFVSLQKNSVDYMIERPNSPRSVRPDFYNDACCLTFYKCENGIDYNIQCQEYDWADPEQFNLERIARDIIYWIEKEIAPCNNEIYFTPDEMLERKKKHGRIATED